MSYALKNKNLQTLDEAKTFVVTIEHNVSTSKIDIPSYPRDKVEVKSNPTTQVNPTDFAQKFEEVTGVLIQGQVAMMNKLSILERERGSHQNYPPKPQFNNDRAPKRNLYSGKNPSQQKVPNTPSPTNVVGQEVLPWCQTCNEFHS